MSDVSIDCLRSALWGENTTRVAFVVLAVLGLTVGLAGSVVADSAVSGHHDGPALVLSLFVGRSRVN